MKSALKLLFLALLSTQCLGMSSLKNGFAKAWAYARTVGSKVASHAKPTLTQWTQHISKPRTISMVDRATLFTSGIGTTSLIAYNLHRNYQKQTILNRISREGLVFLSDQEFDSLCKSLTRREEQEIIQQYIQTPLLFYGDARRLAQFKQYRAYCIDRYKQGKDIDLNVLIHADQDDINDIANILLTREDLISKSKSPEYYTRLCRSPKYCYWFLNNRNITSQEFENVLSVVSSNDNDILNVCVEFAIEKPWLLTAKNCKLLLQQSLGYKVYLFAQKKLEKNQIIALESFVKENPGDLILYNTLSGQFVALMAQSSPSINHLKHHLLNVFFEKFKTRQFIQALQKEVQLTQQNKTAFYHGQDRKWGLYQNFAKQLINHLYHEGLIDNTLRENYLLIQIPEELINPELDALNDHHRFQQEQKTFMMGNKNYKDGRPLYHLFSNMFLFGNYPDSGCCTPLYIEYNRNVCDYKLNSTELFEKLNIPSHVIEKYRGWFFLLEELHRKIYQKGRLLQIAIPNNKLDEYVYQADPYGRNLAPASSYNKSKRYGYGDYNGEFVVPLSIGGVLNPHNTDIEVYAYDPEPTDSALLKEFNEKMDKLVKDIVADVKEQEKGQAPRHLCCTSIASAAQHYKTQATPAM